MKDGETELHRHMKEEADEILFSDIHFDARLQNKVRHAVSQAQGREQEKFRFRKGFRRRGKLWVYGSAAMAAVVLGLTLMLPQWSNQGTKGVNPPASLLATGGDPGAAPQVETRPLQTPDEARMLFGDGLLVPAYAPGKVKLSGIYANGIRKDEAVKVTFQYMFGDVTYSVIEEKHVSPEEFGGFNKIEIRGTQGYLKTVETDAELYWFEGGVKYTVTGVISGSEAVKIAESMK